jgi:Fe-S cluster assembly protein SufD
LTSADAPQAVVQEDSEGPIFDSLDCYNLVFVDGVYSKALSDGLLEDGMTLELLSATSDFDIHWAKGLYGSLERKGQNPVARSLAAFNSAFAQEGILLHVKKTPAKPISLHYVHSSATSDVILHHVLKVDEGANVTILESGAVAARCNMVIEAEIEKDAQLHHIRAQGRDHERRAVTHIFAHLEKRSQFKSFTLTMNGVLTRNETVVEMSGDDGVAHVAGASVGDGNFHHDDTVFITHDALRGESRQVFKKVLRNGAAGVFQGKILVKPDAQKTDGYQISQSLLLDDDSQFLAKPELEIYADDVACSHGSTSGAIDEEALFYLRSRGLPEQEATNLLTLAFLAEALGEVENEDIADLIKYRLEGWLKRRR